MEAKPFNHKIQDHNFSRSKFKEMKTYTKANAKASNLIWNSVACSNCMLQWNEPIYYLTISYMKGC